MEYKKLGNSKRLYNAGQTVDIICPKCNEKTKFSIFKNYDFRLKAELPLLKSSTVYLAVCPNCASTFGIDEEKGKMLEKGEPLSVGNYDLKELNTIVY